MAGFGRADRRRVSSWQARQQCRGIGTTGFARGAGNSRGRVTGSFCGTKGETRDFRIFRAVLAERLGAIRLCCGRTGLVDARGPLEGLTMARQRIRHFRLQKRY